MHFGTFKEKSESSEKFGDESAQEMTYLQEIFLIEILDENKNSANF